MKKLTEGVRNDLQVSPTPGVGDLCTSVVAYALGIAGNQSTDIKTSADWDSLLQKKLLTIFYHEDIRNRVADWAKSNGFTTSTYLGIPIVKFSKIFIILDQSRAEKKNLPVKK